VDQFRHGKAGSEGNPDESGLVTGIIGLHQLMAIGGEKGDPISFS